MTVYELVDELVGLAREAGRQRHRAERAEYDLLLGNCTRAYIKERQAQSDAADKAVALARARLLSRLG